MWTAFPTYDGDEVKTFKPSSYATVMSADEAETIGNYMITTVQSGTASALSGASYTAAGKTGSAEYDTASGERGTHSWFVGYTNVDNRNLPSLSSLRTAVPEAARRFRLQNIFLILIIRISTAIDEEEKPGLTE